MRWRRLLAQTRGRELGPEPERVGEQLDELVLKVVAVVVEMISERSLSPGLFVLILLTGLRVG